jgi:tetratricopeptide (TPR) repeat protein
MPKLISVLGSTLFAGLVFVCPTIPACAQQDQGPAPRGLECKGKDNDEIIVNCTNLLNRFSLIYPTNILAYLKRGFAFVNKGDYDRAIRDFDEATRIDPKDPSAYIFRGSVYRTKRNYDRAI